MVLQRRKFRMKFVFCSVALLFLILLNVVTIFSICKARGFLFERIYIHSINRLSPCVLRFFFTTEFSVAPFFTKCKHFVAIHLTIYRGGRVLANFVKTHISIVVNVFGNERVFPYFLINIMELTDNHDQNPYENQHYHKYHRHLHQ